jgi:hypothetical protein
MFEHSSQRPERVIDSASICAWHTFFSFGGCWNAIHGTAFAGKPMVSITRLRAATQAS